MCIVALVSDTTLLVQLHIGWRLLWPKGYKHIDRDIRRGWDRELKGPRCEGDDNGQDWARVMSGQMVSFG
jgi:hypothetical protein